MMRPRRAALCRLGKIVARGMFCAGVEEEDEYVGHFLTEKEIRAMGLARSGA